MTFTSSDIIALLALVVSVYAIWTTASFNKRQLALTASQEKLNEQLLQQGHAAEVDSKRAELGANFVKVGTGKYRLKVFNKGKAPARNVHIEFVEGSETFIANDVASKFPLEMLEPQQGVELIAAVHMGTQSKHKIRFTWSDDAKEDNEKTVYPTV